MVASILKERPIGAKAKNLFEGFYLSPNDFLSGRTNASATAGYWNECGNDKHRLNPVNQIVNHFQIKWIQQCFPTLIGKRKWHSESRNLCVSNALVKFDWRIVLSLCNQIRINFMGIGDRMHFWWRNATSDYPKRINSCGINFCGTNFCRQRPKFESILRK